MAIYRAADLFAMNVWTQANRKAANAYYEDPLALTRVCESEDKFRKHNEDKMPQWEVDKRILEIHKRERVHEIMDTQYE